jgi:hypothetical protein
MKILDKYIKLQEQIHEYFGYVEDWVAIPLDDQRNMFWYLDLEENGSGEVTFATTEEDLQDEEGNIYRNTIYTQRFLPKWVYRGEEYTMIVVDTHTDGNKFLQIFTNANEREVPVEADLDEDE